MIHMYFNLKFLNPNLYWTNQFFGRYFASCWAYNWLQNAFDHGYFWYWLNSLKSQILRKLFKFSKWVCTSNFEATRFYVYFTAFDICNPNHILLSFHLHVRQEIEVSQPFRMQVLETFLLHFHFHDRLLISLLKMTWNFRILPYSNYSKRMCQIISSKKSRLYKFYRIISHFLLNSS